ncbi:MAG: glutamine--fructose-6-phosphate transaminase (isomerizing) [Bacilli bacterium]|nr:glutamine--fructose-6-phosphate transaminase (isomerizing) [Bacilli bacterium]
MCGIVGYVGEQHPIKILLDGLKCLEYRGYDSSGIVLQNNDECQIIKSVGKISNLEEKINNSKLIESNMGLAHTRWATHGEANEVNAHPHKVGKVTLVHNGIIENAKELKDRLISDGVEFVSETDTEVACALISYYYDKENDIKKAIEKACNEIVGSYAFGILVEGIDKIYAIRKDSPLILGIGEGEYFIASDISAIINYTNQYILLDVNELVEMDSSGYSITTNGKEIKKEVLTATIDASSKEKNGYPHFMLKEIMEEPIVLENTLKPILSDISSLPDLKQYEEIHIIGCGSAYYAGMIGKSLFEENGVRAIAEVASEYRYKKVLYDRKTLVILISQSGETADTIAAMRKAIDNNIDTLAIVNVKTSTIARESKNQIFIEAGPEIAVATTKAYILQVAILSLLAYSCGESDSKVIDDFNSIPSLLREVLDRKDEYLKIAKDIYKNDNIFFIGRKLDYSICMEGSLKLKEVSYIHSEAYQAGELKHGTISLIEEGTPVFGIITEDDIREKTISNVEEVKSRGAKVIVVTNSDIDGYEYVVKVKKVSKYVQSLLVVPVLQLIAYEVAKLRGCDIDKPRNLAKSVTVE